MAPTVGDQSVEKVTDASGTPATRLDGGQPRVTDYAPGSACSEGSRTPLLVAPRDRN